LLLDRVHYLFLLLAALARLFRALRLSVRLRNVSVVN
jgi:hypothetical protein